MTTTISRFGPSGSSKRVNIILDRITDVTTNIINEDFLGDDVVMKLII
jgi:hypothetical protein